MNDKGFTMIEILVSMALFGIIMSSLALSFLSFIRYNTEAQLRTEAQAAAQLTLDDLRRQDPSTFPTSGQDGPTTITIGSRDYDVYTSYCLNASFCTTVNNRHLTVEVLLGARSLYTVETIYTQLR